MCDAEDSETLALRQQADQLEPIGIGYRGDGSFCMFARAPDGVIHMGKLHPVPDRPPPSEQWTALRPLRRIVDWLGEALRSGLGADDATFLDTISELENALEFYLDTLP